MKLQAWRGATGGRKLISWDGPRTQTANGLLRSVQTVGVPAAGSAPPNGAQVSPEKEEEEHAEQPAEAGAASAPAAAASHVYHIHHSNVYFSTGCAAVFSDTRSW